MGAEDTNGHLSTPLGICPKCGEEITTEQSVVITSDLKGKKREDARFHFSCSPLVIVVPKPSLAEPAA